MRVHERLTHAIFVGHGHQGGHLGDQADRRDFAVLWVVDVRAVVIESRQGANQARQHSHGVCVTAEATQEELHLLVDHGVVGHDVLELGFLCGVGQIALQQQIASFEVVTVGRELFDGIAAVQQLTFVTVDVGDA